MTVYEMIQELSKYDADLEVKINVYSNDFYTEGISRENKNINEGEQLDIKINLDEDIFEFCIKEEKPYKKLPIVAINLTL